MRLSHRAVVLFSLIGAVVALAALSAPASATDWTVNITTGGGFNFQPANLVIIAGDRVRWRNQANMQHSSTSGTDCTEDGLWDTGFMNSNTFSGYVTFPTAGLYPYFCVPHCGFNMVGSITVQPKTVPVRKSSWGAIKALYQNTE